MKKLTSLTLVILLGVVACSPIKQERHQDGTYTAVNSGCGYIITAYGKRWWYDDLDLVADNYQPEDED